MQPPEKIRLIPQYKDKQIQVDEFASFVPDADELAFFLSDQKPDKTKKVKFTASKKEQIEKDVDQQFVSRQTFTKAARIIQQTRALVKDAQKDN